MIFTSVVMRSVAFLVLCVPSLVWSTTLVALWTPDTILLGADSRVVTEDGPLEACKIGHLGKVWVAASGLVTESRSGYELGPIIRVALAEAGPLQTKLTRFTERVYAPLSQALDSVRTVAPADYQRLQSGRPVLQAIFAARENGKPVLAIVGFVLGLDGELQPGGSFIDGSDSRGPRIIYAGQRERIREYLKTHPDWIDGDRQSLVRDLVQLEVDAGTPFVGGPVDLMQIDAEGSYWVQRKPACVSEPGL